MYTRLLYATDFAPEEARVAEKAAALATQFGAELYLIHVIEALHGYGIAYETEAVFTWQQEALQAAMQMMEELGRRFAVPEERRFLKQGVAKHVIVQTALEVGVDLIVVGSHGRHGVELVLLGSTADAVLHRAQCDVLAVRIYTHRE